MNKERLEKLSRIAWLLVRFSYALSFCFAILGLVFFGALCALALAAYLFQVKPEWTPMVAYLTMWAIFGFSMGAIYIYAKSIVEGRKNERKG